jgi:replicative DNA helicase
MTTRGSGGVAYDAERANQLERAVLGCLLEEPALWRDASGLDVGHFRSSYHQKIFSIDAVLLVGLSWPNHG